MGEKNGMRRRDFLRSAGAGVAGAALGASARAAGEGGGKAVPASSRSEISVGFPRREGRIKPLHGVNNGPIVWGGMQDLSSYYKEAGFPHARLHDCHWPAPDVVDIHCVFPDFDADPDDPASYTFTKTDHYIGALADLGVDIIYRLGESIEHNYYLYTHPPDDFEKWARVCVNIIRHYNDGWADGFEHGIRYWEIWNEPEIGRPMWSGTLREYYELYRTAATAIKDYDPSLKVGGPAATSPRSRIVKPFLAYCRDHDVPLDFLSWHCYSGRAGEPKRRAEIARRRLDEYGFKDAESHCNEWHLMDAKWSDLRPGHAKDYDKLGRTFERLCGVEGAAFAASALILLQDAPLDVGNYYTGDIGRWGLFDRYGAPRKSYYVFRAFNELVGAPRRVAVNGEGLSEEGVVCCAGITEEGNAARILLSNHRGDRTEWKLSLRHLPWQGGTRIDTVAIDIEHSFESLGRRRVDGNHASLAVNIPRHSVRLVRLQEAQS